MGPQQSGQRTGCTTWSPCLRRFMLLETQANILASGRFKWLRGGSVRTLAALVFNFTRAWMFRSVLTHLLRYALQLLPLRTRVSIALTARILTHRSRNWISFIQLNSCVSWIAILKHANSSQRSLETFLTILIRYLESRAFARTSFEVCFEDEWKGFIFFSFFFRIAM